MFYVLNIHCSSQSTDSSYRPLMTERAILHILAGQYLFCGALQMCTESEGAERCLYHQLFTPEHKFSSTHSSLCRGNQRTHGQFHQQQVYISFLQLIKLSAPCLETDEDIVCCLVLFTRHYNLIHSTLWDIFIPILGFTTFGSIFFIRQHCCNTITCVEANSGSENNCTNYSLSWRHKPVQ